MSTPFARAWPQIESLIDLQLLASARPAELVSLRPMDLDRMVKVWTY